MATQFAEVYDFFMQTITDYRLIDLFNSSQEDFENFLEPWLINAVIEFDGICDQSLTYGDDGKSLVSTLSPKNKAVLAKLMTKYWLQKAVNDITQMNLHVTDRDFKLASEAQNLREKVAYYNILREDCSQMLIEYGYKGADWADWFNQDFAPGV